jgi:uncharacterized protein
MEQAEFDKLFEKVEKFVENIFENTDSSHDFLHVKRVYNLSIQIANKEKDKEPNLQLVRLAAILHDVGDSKYEKVQKKKFESLGYTLPPTIEDYLLQLGCPAELSQQTSDLVNKVSFRKEAFYPSSTPPNIELAIVRDADKLDAIGAIGIARCMAYGSHVNNPIHNRDLETQLVKDQRAGSVEKPWNCMSAEDYAKGGSGTCIAHFYEKLFHLKDMLVTDYAKHLAVKRHAIMLQFVEQLEMECDLQA